jgi:thiol-disulfide isomerase/thioredoxin
MKLKLLAVTCLLACFMPQYAQAKRAPNLEFKDLAGKSHAVAELRGSIAVVNFWATWCGPCREELPMFSKLSQEYGARKVRFVAASADVPKDHAKVVSFAESQNLALDVWEGADLDMMQRAGLGNVLPATMILDDQGEIVARILGQAREEDVRKVLDWLLAGKPAPAPPALTKHY